MFTERAATWKAFALGAVVGAMLAFGCHVHTLVSNGTTDPTSVSMQQAQTERDAGRY